MEPIIITTLQKNVCDRTITKIVGREYDEAARVVKNEELRNFSG
jgi:hypothetical protein